MGCKDDIVKDKTHKNKYLEAHLEWDPLVRLNIKKIHASSHVSVSCFSVSFSRNVFTSTKIKQKKKKKKVKHLYDRSGQQRQHPSEGSFSCYSVFSHFS